MTVIAMPRSAGERAPVAAEVRAEMARAKVRTNHLPKLIGKSQSYWSRRVNGELPFDTDDLENLAELLRVHPAKFFGVFVTTPTPPNDTLGIRPTNPCYSDGRVILGPWAASVSRKFAA